MIKAVSLCLTLLIFSGCIVNKEKILNVAVSSLPFSNDPIDFDAAPNHPLQYSIYKTLISINSSSGEVIPLLADSWETLDDFKTWKFQISKKNRFENGEILSCNDVLKNFKRLALTFKVNESKNGLLENLVGVEKIENLNSDFEGLSCEDEKIIFKFTKSTKDILYKLSFGLYSIVHPSSFDRITGKWLSKKEIASGDYLIKDRKERSLLLELRQNINAHGHKRKFNKILLEVYNENNSYDLALMDSRFENKFPNMIFRGGAVAGIQYISLTKWSNKTSIFSNVNFRQQFYKIFYKKLKDEHFTVPSNFFISSQDVVGSVSEEVEVDLNGEKVRALDIMNLFRDNQKYAKSILDALKYTIEKMHGRIEVVRMSLPDLFEEKKNDYPSLDIVMSSTTLYIASPHTDIKFMFSSKEGIRLPDPTGKIKKITENEVFEINDINKQINEDRVVIPVFHFIKGFFYTKEVDTNLFSNKISSVDFNWIGEI